MTRVLRGSAIPVAVLVFLLSALCRPADASLVGDTVKFQCTNCGPPSDDDFVVVAGVAELNLFNQIEVDVEAASLRLTWLFTGVIGSSLNFVWSDLDSSLGDIVGVTIDPSSTWAAVAIGSGPDSVSATENGDTSVVGGDFLLLNLEFAGTAVPVPATLLLLASSLAGVGAVRAWRRRR